MPWPKTDATYYHEWLGLLRQRPCNQRVGFLMDVTWVLEYRIPLQVDDALNSLDDHLKIEEESQPLQGRVTQKLCIIIRKKVRVLANSMQAYTNNEIN